MGTTGRRNTAGVRALRILITFAIVSGIATMLGTSPSSASELAPRPAFTLTGTGAGGYFAIEDPSGPDGVAGTEDDVPLVYGWGGQLLGPVGENGVATSTYCIDLHTPIDFANSTELGSWDDAVGVIPPSGVNQLTRENLRKIAQIVSNNFPNDDSLVPLSGNDNTKALAVQWAIWHYANGFEPSLAYSGAGYPLLPASVVANYAAIINAVESGIYPAAPEPQLPYLEIVPPAVGVGFADGAPVGPFTIRTNPGILVDVAVDGGAGIVDATGTPLVGPFQDGDQLYVTTGTSGPVTLTITATMAIPVGATYVSADVQRLINATEVMGTFTADTTITFVEPAFDLALRKTLAAGQPATVKPGDEVTFTIEVHNQGDTATNIQVIDHLPAGTVLADADWTDRGDGTASITIPGPLPHGTSIGVDITLRVRPNTQAGAFVNTAEISSAHDWQGHPGVDVDSTPDTDRLNDPLVDDVITSNPGGNPSDEDDHDIARFTVEVPVEPTNGVTQPGSTDPDSDNGGTAALDVLADDATRPQRAAVAPEALAFTGGDVAPKLVAGISLALLGIAILAGLAVHHHRREVKATVPVRRSIG